MLMGLFSTPQVADVQGGRYALKPGRKAISQHADLCRRVPSFGPLCSPHHPWHPRHPLSLRRIAVVIWSQRTKHPAELA